MFNKYIMNNNLVQEAIAKFCRIDNESVYIDYQVFKHIASDLTYDVITQMIVNSLTSALSKSKTFIIHLSLKHLTLKELDKHYNYIAKICALFKSEFPDKLETCYIYNAPFVFSQIISIISVFIDKKTQKKICLMDKSSSFDNNKLFETL